jgi:hypothetical protein
MSQARMKFERIKYRQWPEAYRCVIGAAELIVVSSVGPRILSLRSKAGPNLLYEDASDFRVGDWRLYGGHRFTVAPEGEETYAPDNAPCVASVVDNQLRITAALAANGLQRVLLLGATADGQGFELRHVLENHGSRPWSGALWGITCVNDPGRVVAPCTKAALRCWPGTDGTRLEDQCRLGPDHVVVATKGARGKVGWFSDPSWLAWLHPEATFVIHCPAQTSIEECVDEGCNAEVFACPEYTELETLSGRLVVAPGERAEHIQRWRLLAPIYSGNEWEAASSMVRRLCSINASDCGS